MTHHLAPLIMIHGFRGTHHGLRLIAQQLPDRQVIIPDLPGFGKGELLPNYTLDTYVEWLHQFVKAQKLNQTPELLGHSFGSVICAAYAAKYPHTIDQLILVNPIGAPALEGPRSLLTKLAIFYYWLGEKLPARVAHAWLAAPLMIKIMSVAMTKTKDKALRRFIHNEHRQHFSDFHSARSVGQAFKASVSHNVRDFAPDITLPTTLIVGDQDDITPLAKQQDLVKLFPQASLKIIKNVGHLSHYETPDQVAAFIKSV